MNDWVREFGGAATVCDQQGIIIEMNDESVRNYGDGLVGTSLFDCHPEKAGLKLRQLMDDRRTNIYTAEKSGIKKLVYQSPWYKDGKYMGFMEIVMKIPAEMPHFIRDAQKG
jgi:hypothetical protein